MSDDTATASVNAAEQPGHKHMALGLALIFGGGGVILWGLWAIGSALFAGSLFGVVSNLIVLVLLVAALGVLVPLPLFLNSRILAALLGGALMFLAMPWAEGLKSPADIARAAKHERNEQGSSLEPSDTAVIAGAQIAIKSRAVDPDSVRFRNVRANRQASGTKAVCGEFNAKNRAGGYNGFERFVSAGVDRHTWIESEVADFEAAWNSLCGR